MTGFELLDLIQTEPALKDLPIVVFTGKDLSTAEEAQAAHRGQERSAQGRAVAGAPV